MLLSIPCMYLDHLLRTAGTLVLYAVVLKACCACYYIFADLTQAQPAMALYCNMLLDIAAL